MNLETTPDNLPVPDNDGAAAHLLQTRFPDIAFTGTNNQLIKVNDSANRVVLYIYPMTGRPDVPLPDGWDDIPGARGCTPQSCSFRDHQSELHELGASVHGLSSQTTEYQQEARDRLHLPFELLSDSQLELKKHLRLPTFYTDNKELYKRMTLIINKSVIEHVFYPVFPPGENAQNVLAWLRSMQ